MNILEEKMLNTLKELKEEYSIVSVKTEFEAEGASLEEAYRLKELSHKANLDFTLKIGGCEAIKDMQEAKKLDINALVAPMIESPYAVFKYTEAIKKVFNKKERQNIKFLINIETKYGFQYLDEILNSDFSKDIQGIVLGRSDLACSLGLNKENTNSDIILDYAKKMSEIIAKYNKEFIVGGNIDIDTLAFLDKLDLNKLNRFETRKIIFNAKKVLSMKDRKNAIQKAIDFELLWIKNKENYNSITKEDYQRIENLKSRI